MIGSVARRMQRQHAGDAVAIRQLDIGIEAVEAADAKPDRRRAGRSLQLRHRADMVVMRVADQDQRDACRRWRAGSPAHALDGPPAPGPARRCLPACRSGTCWCRNRSSARDWRRRCGRCRASPAAPRRGRVRVRSGRAWMASLDVGVVHAAKRRDWQRSGRSCQDRRQFGPGRKPPWPTACCSRRSIFPAHMRTNSTTGMTWSTSRSGCACRASSTPSAGSATKTRRSPLPPTTSTARVCCTARHTMRSAAPMHRCGPGASLRCAIA